MYFADSRSGTIVSPHHGEIHFYIPSSTNLFVRYLPHEVDDNRLREIFSTFGRITSSMVMRDIHNGQSLGTAFVRYETHEEAQVALREANGMPLGAKTISVQWAKQQHDGTPAGEDRLKMNKLFLRNVPLDVTEEELSTMMAAYGAVERVSLHNDTAPVTDPALRRRIAFVTFAELGAAETALREVHNTCAFNGCCGIPLMGKLITENPQHRRGRAGQEGVAREMGKRVAQPDHAIEPATPRQHCPSPSSSLRVTVMTRWFSVDSLGFAHATPLIPPSEDSGSTTLSFSCTGSLVNTPSSVTPNMSCHRSFLQNYSGDSCTSASLGVPSTSTGSLPLYCHDPYSPSGAKLRWC